MRYKRIVLLLLAFGLVGCGTKDSIEESVVETTVEETTETETETETVETEEAKEEGAKTFLMLQDRSRSGWKKGSHRIIWLSGRDSDR